MANELQSCLGTVFSERRERRSEKGEGGRMKKKEKLQEPTERKDREERAWETEQQSAGEQGLGGRKVKPAGVNEPR